VAQQFLHRADTPQYIMTRRLKALIMEPKEIAIARKHLGKHVSATTNKHAAVEEIFESLISMHSVPKLYDEGQLTVELVASQQVGG
jgi:hypothetical protein